MWYSQRTPPKPSRRKVLEKAKEDISIKLARNAIANATKWQTPVLMRDSKKVSA